MCKIKKQKILKIEINFNSRFYNIKYNFFSLNFLNSKITCNLFLNLLFIIINIHNIFLINLLKKKSYKIIMKLIQETNKYVRRNKNLIIL